MRRQNIVLIDWKSSPHENDDDDDELSISFIFSRIDTIRSSRKLCPAIFEMVRVNGLAYKFGSLKFEFRPHPALP
jgi:hypothetical protein